MKKIEGLTKWGTVAYYCGVMRKDKRDHWCWRWLHPFTIVVFGLGFIITLFWDGFKTAPEAWRELKNDCVWW